MTAVIYDAIAYVHTPHETIYHLCLKRREHAGDVICLVRLVLENILELARLNIA